MPLLHFRAAFVETCGNFLPGEATDIHRFTTGAGEEGFLFTLPSFTDLSAPDRAHVMVMLQNGPNSDTHRSGRTIRLALDRPIRDPDFFDEDSMSITHVDLKGGTLVPGQPLIPYFGGGLARQRRINRDGFFENVAPVIDVCHGLYAAEAYEEIANVLALRFAMRPTLQFGNMLTRLKLPLGWVYFPELAFHGQPLGVSLWGLASGALVRPMPIETEFDLIDAVKLLGTALRDFHVHGFFHPFLHGGNISKGPNTVFGHDWGSSINMARHQMTPKHFRRYVINDLWYVLVKMYSMAEGQAMTPDQKVNFLRKLMTEFSMAYSGDPNDLDPIWDILMEHRNNSVGLNRDLQILDKIMGPAFDQIFAARDARFRHLRRQAPPIPTSSRLSHQEVVQGVEHIGMVEPRAPFHLAARLLNILPSSPYHVPLANNDVEFILRLGQSRRGPAELTAAILSGTVFGLSSAECQAFIKALVHQWHAQISPFWRT